MSSVTKETDTAVVGLNSVPHEMMSHGQNFTDMTCGILLRTRFYYKILSTSK